MITRFFLLFCLGFVMTCGGNRQLDTHKPSGPNVVGSETNQTQNFKWVSERKIRDAVKKPSGRPIYLIFAASWCNPCHQLLRIIATEGWDQRLYLANIEERWVQRIAQLLSIRGLPTLIVASADGSSIKRKIEGAPAIITYLAVHLE